jgi:hypothetical protein
MSRNTSDTATIWAPLAQVRISERRSRSVSQSTVERYRSWLEQGDGYVVRDGRHRVAAALAAGHTVVKAQVCRIATMARAAFRRRSRNLRASTHTWG